MAVRRFRLEPVLSYRESLVEARELELAQALKRRNEAERALRALQEERMRTLQAVRSLHRADKVDPLRLAAAESYLARLEGDLARQAAVVAELTQKAEAAREALCEALKDKKKVERLKAREEERIAWEEARAEQRFIDELTTLRHNRRKGMLGR